MSKVESTSLSFVDAKSPIGRRVLAMHRTKFQTGDEQLIVLSKGELYCVIEKLGEGFAAIYDSHEFWTIQPSLEACMEMVVKTYGRHKKVEDFQINLLERWLQGDYSVEESLGSLVEMAAFLLESGWVLVFYNVATGRGPLRIDILAVDTGKKWMVKFDSSKFDFSDCEGKIPESVLLRVKQVLDNPEVLHGANSYWTDRYFPMNDICGAIGY